ncbi:MAG: peptidoglycan DD-metalloendopeptidase family protein [Candidatus Gracilibacteria bacterium]|jgi:murein DD-endopeptidase MepM/ murein hydrolase activator NlpD
MHTKSYQYFAGLILCSLITANLFTPLALAEMKSIVLEVKSDESQNNNSNLEENSVTEGEKYLDEVMSALNMNKLEYRQLLKNIEDTQKRIENIKEEKMSLTTQLDLIDYQLDKTKKKYIDVMKQIFDKENRIKAIEEETQIKEIAFEAQKELLRDYAKILYEKEKEVLEIDENGDVNTVKLLFSDQSIGENFRQLKYLDILNETGQEILIKLENISTDLENLKDNLKKEKIKLQQLQVSVEAEKNNLEEQKQSKEMLVKISTGQEQIYGKLIEQSIAQQEDSLNQIKNLSSAMVYLQDEMTKNGGNFDKEKFLELIDGKTKAVYEFNLSNLNASPAGTFIWPIEPKKGLSAYFRDPSYSGVFGVKHNAIDIPTNQQSLVRAAADGVVYTTKDNGYGYSYIIIAHAGGYQTVYGHITEILVKEGQTIKQGSIIGLSGGMPGTKGAGYMTTGPHLHFEMLLNGSYVDPLDNLPLSNLSFDNIENLPEKFIEKWKEENGRERGERVLRNVGDEIE